MKFSTLEALMGLPINDKYLLERLRNEGVDIENNVFLPEGEFTAYFENPLVGYCLIFTDEAIFLGRKNQTLNEGPLYLSGAFFYSEGYDHYAQYEHGLTENISFADTREAIQNKLGVPLQQNMTADRWDKTNYSIFISYSEQKNSPLLISIFKPNAELQ